MCASFSPENVQTGAEKGLTMSCLRSGIGGDCDPQEMGEREKATPNTTLAATTRMISTLRWAAMRALLMLHCHGVT